MCYAARERIEGRVDIGTAGKVLRISLVQQLMLTGRFTRAIHC